MTRVTAYIKPHRLEPVKSAIAAVGVTGMSVGDVRGIGNSPEESDYLGGGGVVALPIRARIDVIAEDETVETIVKAIIDSGYTGAHDDGKIFLERVQDAYRIRTGERGDLGL